MKLINEKSIYLFAAYLLIFVIVGVLFYFTVNTIIYLDYKEKLLYRKQYTIKQLQDSDSVLVYSKFSGYTLSIRPIRHSQRQKQIFSDTIIYDEVEDKYFLFRQLKFYTTVKGVNYQVMVRRSLIETDDIIEGLVVVTFVVFIILLLTLFLVNQYISKRVWRPFYATLENIKKYEVGNYQKIMLPKTDIQEFKELITVLNTLMDKISGDFKALKEFTENISHEVQTPLSIMKSKLELLLQSEQMDNNNLELISSTYQAANRLSKLAESLSLLIKIENYQFTNFKQVDFHRLFVEKFEAYKELLEIKNIQVSKSSGESFIHSIDPALADILVENLVVNSIKHNVKGGSIFYELGQAQICIRNTGKSLKVVPNELFQRFTKHNSNSLGLGLSIVKNICTINKLSIEYTFESGYHTICIKKAN